VGVGEITVEELNRRLNHPENLCRRDSDSSGGGSPSRPIKSEIEQATEPPLSPETPPENEAVGRSEARSLEVTDVLLEDVIQEATKKRKEQVQLSMEGRVVAGTLAHLQSTSSVAELLGVSPGTVHNLKHGQKMVTDPETGKQRKLDHPELREKVSRNIGLIAELSSDVTVQALAKITPEGLEKLPPHLLARLAKDTAAVFEKMTGHKSAPHMSQVVIIAQPGRQVSDYEFVAARGNDLGVIS